MHAPPPYLASFNRIARLLYFIFYQLNKVSRARCAVYKKGGNRKRDEKFEFILDDVVVSMASIFDGSV